MLMYLKQERDHGTPARTANESVQLQIDGYEVSVPKGTSLMRAAVEAGRSEEHTSELQSH